MVNYTNDLETVDEDDLLSKLIETSASKDKPIIVKNNQNQIVGVIITIRSFKSSYRRW